MNAKRLTPEEEERRREQREAEQKQRLDEWVKEQAAKAPPLTEAQIIQLRELLRPRNPLPPVEARTPPPRRKRPPRFSWLPKDRAG
jgi:Fic family protein